MDPKIDDVDRKILAELIENPRLPAKDMAKKLNIHPNTYFLRLRKLEKSKAILKYTTIVDYEKLGYGLQAVIFINVKMDPTWENLIKPIAALPEIYSFILLTGEYDAMAIVRVKDKDGLSELLRKIQRTGVVQKTTTHMVLDYFKHSYEYNPLLQEMAKAMKK